MAVYKRYQKLNLAAIDLDPSTIDLSRNHQQSSKLTIVSYINVNTVKESCARFNGYNLDPLQVPSVDMPIYECESIPGKCV